MSSYYTVRIPVKPHIEKFYHNREGYPIKSSDQNIPWLLIRPYLMYKRTDNRAPAQRNRQLESLKGNISVQISRARAKHYGLSASPQGIILLNMVLDNMFGRELFWFVQSNVTGTGRYPGIKTAIEKFCTAYGIELEEDISLNTIQMIYKRHAINERKKIGSQNVPSRFTC